MLDSTTHAEVYSPRDLASAASLSGRCSASPQPQHVFHASIVHRALFILCGVIVNDGEELRWLQEMSARVYHSTLLMLVARDIFALSYPVLSSCCVVFLFFRQGCRGESSFPERFLNRIFVQKMEYAIQE